MAQSSRTPRGLRRVLALSVWLFSLFLHAYPPPFRRAYGVRMARVFRDCCHATLQQRGLAGLISLWLHTLPDLVISAFLERWHVLKEKVRSMATYRNTQYFPLRLWIALATTLITFAISLVANLNLYLIEDSSPLTNAAYAASPLLRFSYDATYLSALAAGVAVCAIVGYAFVQRDRLVIACLIIVALLVAFGGFGGLIVRHAATFLVFFAIFAVLTLLSFLPGRVVATRSVRILGQRPAALLGACVSAGSVLLVNVVALVLHTLVLNPVSHALYMQGQIGETSLNFSLIAMAIALLTMIACIVSLGFALRLPSPQPRSRV